MTSLPRLGRTDRGIVSELRNKFSAVVANVPEEAQPAALERLLDWQEAQLARSVFGGGRVSK